MNRMCLAFILAALLLTGGCRAKDSSKQSTESSSQDAAETPSGSRDTPPADITPADTTRAPVPTAASSSRPDARPLLVCFGDSLTAGYGTEAGQSYPDFLQADLDARGFRYHVLNEGVSGATSKDGVARLPDILALKPAVVIIEFGGNDGLRGLPVKEMRANLDTILHTLKASGARVMLAGITLPPDYGPDYVTEFTATYPVLAKKYDVPVLPFLLQNVFGVDGMMQRDLTHATARGNRIVAENVLPVVLPLLRK